MATVLVNGQKVTIGDGEKLNCVQAAERAGIEVPHYCWHEALSVVASCRMCLVEYGDTKPDGTVAMQPKLVPGCQTPVRDGSVVISDSENVKRAQKATLEYLLLNHPLDCPVCDQAGECYLQDYSFKYGRAYSRLSEPKNIKPDKDHIGAQITLFTDRCIMCTRCVRFTREISGTSELQVVSRGTHEEIDIFPGQPCDNKLAGNVVDLCPVGALCSKDFLYEQRVWWLQTKNSVCNGCSTGCSIKVDQNKDVLYRLRPRENPQAQGHFMCDEGRFGWKYIHSEKRLRAPLVREQGQQVTKPWDQVYAGVRNGLEAAARNGAVAFVLSPFMTVEEAYLLSKYAKSLGSSVQLALGPVPVVGQDDVYPKNVHGQPAGPAKFTIRAEKCPNRAGVEHVLQHYQGSVIPFAQVLDQAARGELQAVYLVGGDITGSLNADVAGRLKNVPLLVVQDLLENPVTLAAHYVLAGAAWAERDGTFVNHKQLAQAIHKGLRSPGEARADGRLLAELTARPGMYHSPTIRQEIAGEIPALAALIVGDLGEDGVFLNAAPAAMSQSAGAHAQTAGR